MPTIFAWLFDVYPSGNGMSVWMIDREGRSHELRDTFHPRFYVQGSSARLRDLSALLAGNRAPVDLRMTERIDLFLDRPIEVLEVRVTVPGRLPRLFRRASRAFPDLTYYDADLPLPQRYVLERELFPLAYCAVDVADGTIQSIEALDTPWDTDYELPPFRVMTLRLDGDLQDPSRSIASKSNRGNSGDLLVEVDDHRYHFARRQGRQLVSGVRHLLERFDPDVLITAYGDNYILPRLLRLSRHYGISSASQPGPKAAGSAQGRPFLLFVRQDDVPE